MFEDAFIYWGLAGTKIADPLIAATRASEGTYFDGISKTAAVDELRFHHDPATGQSLGPLIERGAENISLNSEALDQWLTARLDIVPNAAFSPDGFQTAEGLDEDLNPSNHRLEYDLTGLEDNEDYVVSRFLEPVNREWAFLQQIGKDGGSHGQYFNLPNSLVSGVSGLSFNPGIVDTGSNWRRCWFAFNAMAGVTTTKTRTYVALDNGVLNFDGLGQRSLNGWGFEVKKGRYPTSYVKSTSVPGIREPDIVSAPIDPGLAYRWYVAGRTAFGSGVQVLGQFGTQANGVKVERNLSDEMHVIVTVGGVVQADINLGIVAHNTDIKVAARIEVGNFQAAMASALGTPVLTGTVPATTIYYAGQDEVGNHWDHTWAEFALWLTPGTDADLLELVTPPIPEPVEPRKFPFPPVFTIAFIDAGIPEQQGQEEMVAKYPLALVPQQARADFFAWRDKIRGINPDIKLLAYQHVLAETTVPGPGHDEYIGLVDPWLYWPDLTIPTIDGNRYFDYRKQNWQDAFVAGCEAIMASYPFQGIFFDNCIVTTFSHPDPVVRDELYAALNAALARVRATLGPDVILIGNSRDNWHGLNGEMNEGRPQDLSVEVERIPEHAEPRIDLFQLGLKTNRDEEQIPEMLVHALKHGVMFGTSYNSQNIYWHPLFETVIANYYATYER